MDYTGKNLGTILTELCNDGFYEAVDGLRHEELAEYIYRNDATLEQAADALNAWLEE